MNISLKPLVVSFLLLTCMKSIAAITSFSEDYEGLAVASENGHSTFQGYNESELSSLGWKVGANVFDGTPSLYSDDDRGEYLYFYGWYPAPNTTTSPGFSQVRNEDADNDGGTTNYLNIFSNYNDFNVHASPPTSINSLFVKEFVIDASDIGKTITFTFDAKRPAENLYIGTTYDQSAAVGNNCISCTAGAFLKTIDPSTNYSQTNYVIEDMSWISQSTWETFSISLELSEPLLEGQVLQVGFENFATNFENTGVYYDNVNLEISGVPLPAGIYLFLSGLVGLGFAKSKRKVSNFK